MKKIFFNFVLLSASFNLLGCAHFHTVDKTSEAQGVRVNIGGEEVKEGDLVNVLQLMCKPPLKARPGPAHPCLLKKIGTAKVVQVIDDKKALVQPENGLQIQSDMRVEKQDSAAGSID